MFLSYKFLMLSWENSQFTFTLSKLLVRYWMRPFRSTLSLRYLFRQVLHHLVKDSCQRRVCFVWLCVVVAEQHLCYRVCLVISVLAQRLIGWLFDVDETSAGSPHGPLAFSDFAVTEVERVELDDVLLVEDVHDVFIWTPCILCTC